MERISTHKLKGYIKSILKDRGLEGGGGSGHQTAAPSEGENLVNRKIKQDKKKGGLT